MDQTHTVLNYFDYAVLGIVGLSGFFALFRGFVREVFALVAWTGAYLAAVRLRYLAVPYVTRYVHQKDVTDLASGALTFFAALVLLTIIGMVLARLIVRGQALTAIDRSLGFLFGLLRGALIVCLIYFAMATVLWPDIDKSPEEPAQAAPQTNPETAEAGKSAKAPAPEWLMQAKTRPFLREGAALLKTVIPEKDILEKATTAYEQEKAATQRMIDQHRLDMLSTPVPASAKQEGAASYDDKSRLGLDQLLKQKDQP